MQGKLKKKDEGEWRGRVVKQLTKSILEKTYDGSAIVFIILASLGKTTLDMFLNPSYYVEDPAIVLGEISAFRHEQLERKKIRQTLDRLQKYGLVKKEDDKYSLTMTGKKIKNKIFGYKEKLEEKWDGKYRLVIFDIPEVDRYQRDWLRGELYFLGYIKLQNSVFISKISLTEDIVEEIKERGIEGYVNYLLVDHVHDFSKLT